MSDTGGGAYVGGDVDTGGGRVIGRDSGGANVRIRNTSDISNILGRIEAQIIANSNTIGDIKLSLSEIRRDSQTRSEHIESLEEEMKALKHEVANLRLWLFFLTCAFIAGGSMNFYLYFLR